MLEESSESLDDSPSASEAPSRVEISAASYTYPGELRASGPRFNVDWTRLWHGKRLLKASQVGYKVKGRAQMLGKRAIASIWAYGAELDFVDDDGAKSTLFLCKECHISRRNPCCWTVDGTSHIKKHVRKAHNVDPDTGLLPMPEALRASTPWEHAAAAVVAGGSGKVSHVRWQEEELQLAYVDWVVINDLSFNMSVHPSTRGLLTWNRTPLLRALPMSHTTLSKYVITRLRDRKKEIRNILSASASKISVNCDIWSSPNNVDFLGVVAHFVDAKHQQRDLLIAFRALFCNHTGALQAQIILDVVREYDFTQKLHCFVGDNAANNGTTFIDELEAITPEDLHIGTQHQIRCAGHIINLITKALIYGRGVSKFEEQLAKASPGEQYVLFRSRGAVGKLHNFVNATCNSHKRRRLFQDIQRSVLDEDKLFSFSTLNLVKDGGIRWHSVYLMLLCCNELREPICRFFKRARDDVSAIDDKYCPTIDSLSDDEWDEVTIMTQVLKTFYENTKSLEGNSSSSGFGSMWQTIVNLQEIYAFLNGDDENSVYQIDGFEDCAYMVSGVALALEKLITYFEKLVLDTSPSLYCVATALHPYLRLSWFKTHWRKHDLWHKKAEKSIKDVFKQYLEAEDLHDRDDNEQLPDPPSRRKVPGAYASDERRLRTIWVDDHLLTGKKSFKRQKRTTQLDKYFDSLYEDKIAASASPDLAALLQDPHRWWTEIGQKRYPVVYKMAMDHLSVPATSCDCERCFSSAKRTITCDRNSLSPAVIEALQLQKNWLRRDAVTSHLTQLVAHIVKKDGEQQKEGDDVASNLSSDVSANVLPD